ncbi:MAG: hypothetical protein IT311_03000, partial [Anaerolineales bacterium]|nr:hypothetical protein [Anaerolineales bacterium]
MPRIKFHLLPTFFILLIWIITASSQTVALAQESSASPTPPSGIFITVLGDEPFAN